LEVGSWKLEAGVAALLWLVHGLRGSWVQGFNSRCAAFKRCCAAFKSIIFNKLMISWYDYRKI